MIELRRFAGHPVKQSLRTQIGQALADPGDCDPRHEWCQGPVANTTSQNARDERTGAAVWAGRVCSLV